LIVEANDVGTEPQEKAQVPELWALLCRFWGGVAQGAWDWSS
jgi:hypothetical protein